MGKSSILSIEKSGIGKSKQKNSTSTSKNQKRITKTIYMDNYSDCDWNELNDIIQKHVRRFNKKSLNNISVEINTTPKENDITQEEINNDHRIRHRSRNNRYNHQEPRIPRFIRRRGLRRQTLEAMIITIIWSLFMISLSTVATLIIFVILA
ncbi:hypothetical protein QTN25_002245 [Entamoeba marina]